MNFSSVVLSVVVVFCAGFESFSHGAQDERPALSVRKPNFVIVLSDDQRFEYLGCQGHPFLKTPSIDSLAGEGVRFENAFATSAACTPNRTCILTGQYERKHGITFGSQSSLSMGAFRKPTQCCCGARDIARPMSGKTTRLWDCPQRDTAMAAASWKSISTIGTATTGI